jgi:hypothetical protein
MLRALCILAVIGTFAAMAGVNILSCCSSTRTQIASSHTKTAVTQAIVYSSDKGAYPTSLRVLRDSGYANLLDADPWYNPYVLAPVLTSGAKPRDGDDVYIYSKGPKGTGTYPRPFTLNTGEDGSVGYSSLYGAWSGH